MDDWRGAGPEPGKPSPSHRRRAAAQSDNDSVGQYWKQAVPAESRRTAPIRTSVFSASVSAREDNHYRHVICSPSRVSRHHQFARRFVRIRMAAQYLRDTFVVDVGRKSVAAQHQAVAALEAQRERLGPGRPTLARAERSRNDILMLMMAPFFGRELSDFDQPLHQ